MIATWHGPFVFADVVLPEQRATGQPLQPIRVAVGGSVVVLATTASQMAAGDSTWWALQ